MSQYLVELYTPKTAWMALPSEKRGEFLDGIGSAMANLTALGVEVLALAEIESDIDHSSTHRFLGVWRFPDPQARDALLAGVKACGWYYYFDHVNAASNAGGFAPHLAALMDA